MSLPGRFHSVAADEQFVYVAQTSTDLTTGSILRVNKEDLTYEALVAEAANPLGLAVDDDAVYWSELNSGRVVKIAKAGGESFPSSRDCRIPGTSL